MKTLIIYGALNAPIILPEGFEYLRVEAITKPLIFPNTTPYINLMLGGLPEAVVFNEGLLKFISIDKSPLLVLPESIIEVEAYMQEGAVVNIPTNV